MEVRKQFGRPSGAVGALVGHLMAVKNRQRSLFVLSLLDVGPEDRVLEIGFGPGVDVARVAERASRGFVAGIDHSEVMVRQAVRRNAEAIGAGRVELRLGNASRLPHPDGCFDKAFAINVAQFWSRAAETLAEVRRVLRPGGLAAIAVQPRSKGASEETARQTGEALARALKAAGFKTVRLESRPLRPVSVVVALANA